MTTEDNDREAGRQLAWVLAVVSGLAAGGVIWLGKSLRGPVAAWAIAIPIGLLILTVAAF